MEPNQPAVKVCSEIGKLEKVMLHAPGPEVENMTPENAQKALYSDILNLTRVTKEYRQFQAVLAKLTETFEVKTLLAEILGHSAVRTELLAKICSGEENRRLLPTLQLAQAEALAQLLIEGVPLQKDTLTAYLSKERFALQPLHNFFYMRDASVVTGDRVLISRMANRVRERETHIMEAIFRHHPKLQAETFHLSARNGATIEGGDILVAREDLLIIGQSGRTNTEGIDALLAHLKSAKRPVEILVQELPFKPESFIHLDMVFTFLDRDACMVYQPLILDSNRFLTIRITVDNGKVTIREAPNLIAALGKLGIDLTPISCGGDADTYTQDREQWHSGANFFCLGPGQVIGYERNVHTMNELARNGFAILSASDLLSNKVTASPEGRWAIAIEGDELSRGGGGCRCMTLPLLRQPVAWH
ncbi:MAG: arginine deiminase family protein [Desulfosarcinaceae bacterium]|nr:arginine deiminase family protein [Desulfosarcinaceae bacterium]